MYKKLIRSMKNPRSLNRAGGFILPVLLITGVVLVLIITVVSSETVTNKNIASHSNYAVDAQMAADAGLDNAMNKMNTITDWTGTGGEVTLLSDSTQNIKTTYEVTVGNGVDANHKTLTVTAKAYSPITATSPKVTRKYLMDVEAVTTGGFSPSVATGVGGLVLNGNAKVTGGDVIVDGTITMSNNAQIGLSTNPVNVRVADQACPADHGANYPRVCSVADGDTITDPIVMGSTARIYADVIATNQTNGNNMTNDGLQSGQSFSPVSLPAFDRDSFKNTITTTMSNTDAQTCSGGTVNWPAGVHITGGDVITPNNCTVKINGNVWIDGSLTLRNNAQLVVQDTVGTTMPDLVVDGSGGVVVSNNGIITPNSSNTGIEVVTFWNTTGTSCTPNPADCTTVTGADLYNSQNTTTINLSNNGAAPNSILYAYWSKAQVSNNGNLGAVAGQTVELGNNAVINFTSSISGSDNQQTTWVKRGYMRLYN